MNTLERNTSSILSHLYLKTQNHTPVYITRFKTT